MNISCLSDEQLGCDTITCPDKHALDFNNNNIRIVDIDGKPWFVAADVCHALGYNVKSDGTVNTSNALRTLGSDEIITLNRSETRGRPPKGVSESGLYKLIMRSDKPEAKALQEWVTRVVLPPTSARCVVPKR